MPAPEFPWLAITALHWSHARWLGAAETRPIGYNIATYPIHGVPGNAVRLAWAGLLVDDPAAGGMVLTPAGRAYLAAWRSSPEGRAETAPAAPDPTPRPNPHARPREHAIEPLTLF